MSFVLPVQLFFVWITMQQLLKPLSFIRLMQNSVIFIPPRKEKAQLTLRLKSAPNNFDIEMSKRDRKRATIDFFFRDRVSQCVFQAGFELTMQHKLCFNLQ